MVLSVDKHEFDEFNQLATGWSAQHHPLGAMACRSTVFLVRTSSLQVAHVQHAATLERGFRETYGMTPKAMMTAMRLSGARRQLLHPSPATTVTAVALRWGFSEFGRFSGQYCHRYGEVPSETLRRARREPPQPDGSSRHGTRFSGLVRSIRQAS
jgi:AraC-like DNA-binding protein